MTETTTRGGVPVARARATLGDVPRHAGVPPATASRALDGVSRRAEPGEVLVTGQVLLRASAPGPAASGA